MAKRHEAAKKNSQLAKSEMEERNSDSDYSNEVLFLASKCVLSRVQMYSKNVRPEKEHGSEFTSIRKAGGQHRNHDEPASSH